MKKWRVQNLVTHSLLTSVVDPKTLNLDPDLGFWSNLDPDPELCYQLWKKKFKIILEKNNFSLKKVYFFKTIRTNCNLKKFFSSWVSELLIKLLNTDPDTQHCFQQNILLNFFLFELSREERALLYSLCITQHRLYCLFSLMHCVVNLNLMYWGKTSFLSQLWL